MHFDGSKLLRGLGAGVVLTSPKGDKLQYVLQMHFRASNNIAEYEALVHGLKMAKQIGIRRILCFGDSDLVTHQVSGDWDAKDANMASYRFYVQQLSGFFKGCEFHHVPRENNEEADRLSKIGSTRQDIPAGVSLDIIRKPSIKPSSESPSIFVPGDLAPAQVPPPDPGAADSALKEAAG
jgi:ribonuclease HI